MTIDPRPELLNPRVCARDRNAWHGIYDDDPYAMTVKIMALNDFFPRALNDIF
jgi:hypothetical protein